jgi:hypothetical protein
MIRDSLSRIAGRDPTHVGISADQRYQMRLTTFPVPDELIREQANLRNSALLLLLELHKTETKMCILHSSSAVRPSANATASS